MENLLSVAEAKAILGCTKQYIHQLRAKGEFPGARMMGGYLFIPEADIKAYQKRRKKK